MHTYMTYHELYQGVVWEYRLIIRRDYQHCHEPKVHAVEMISIITSPKGQYKN